MNTAAAQEKASSVYNVKRSDLPACCPRPEQQIDGLHPKVFIALDKDGRGACPYCGAEFVVEG